MSDRAYPLPRTENDPRFSYGLFFDVAKVLEEHGYPRVSGGGDWVGLQLALFNFIYAKADQ